MTSVKFCRNFPPQGVPAVMLLSTTLTSDVSLSTFGKLHAISMSWRIGEGIVSVIEEVAAVAVVEATKAHEGELHVNDPVPSFFRNVSAEPCVEGVLKETPFHIIGFAAVEEALKFFISVVPVKL